MFASRKEYSREIISEDIRCEHTLTLIYAPIILPDSQLDPPIANEMVKLCIKVEVDVAPGRVSASHHHVSTMLTFGLTSQRETQYETF